MELIKKLLALEKILNQKKRLDLVLYVQKFINALKQNVTITELTDFYSRLNSDDEFRYFTQIKIRKQIEDLNLFILKAIYEKVSQNNLVHEIPTENKKKASKYFTFAMVGLFGTIFTALDGASVIEALITSFISLNSIPFMLMLPLEILFAGIAVGAFYIYEMTTLGKKLGLSSLDLGRVFRLYAEQTVTFKHLFDAINYQMAVCTSEKAFTQLKDDYNALFLAYTHHNQRIKEAKEAAKPSRLKIFAQGVLTFFAAGIFGSLAAVGAQPILATTVLPLLLGVTVAAGPIGVGITLGIMAICAISAAAFYLFFEKRAGQLVNKMWGTPTKSIEKIIKSDQSINKCIMAISQIKKKNELVFQSDKQKDKKIEALEEQLSSLHPGTGQRTKLMFFNKPEIPVPVAPKSIISDERLGKHLQAFSPSETGLTVKV